MVDSTLSRPGRPAVPDDYDSPLTELAALAVQNHELYTAYVAAGFTEPQAMQLLIAIVTAGIGGGL
ncbi:hypothetical protein [Streptomyces mirabilis]|uniref:hypothetical protein n=1 Tax=Streptomyces mirabilis TaxID=68239 RepID=UPI0033DDF7A1